MDMALSPGLADWLLQRGHDAVLDLTLEEDLPTSLITIERWRIRKRRLPIKAH
ncbi:MAG: hypothetical protein ACHQ9S_16700 [Candidatus Binatia bacterium]